MLAWAERRFLSQYFLLQIFDYVTCLPLLGICCDLDVKCPLQTHVLEAWSPAGGAILKVLETLGGGS
jgi:hypothetical protein